MGEEKGSPGTPGNEGPSYAKAMEDVQRIGDAENGRDAEVRVSVVVLVLVLEIGGMPAKNAKLRESWIWNRRDTAMR